MVVCSLNQHYVLLQCNLVYTGLTRGKLVVLIGQKKALGIAISVMARDFSPRNQPLFSD